MHIKRPTSISACLIGLNHAKYLPITMKSAFELGDELIYVDLGSEDGSVNIANEFDAKIVHADRGITLDEARELARNHSKGNWILDLDPGHEVVVHDVVNAKATIGDSKSDVFFLPEYSLANTADYLYQPLLYKNEEKPSYDRVFRGSPSMTPLHTGYPNISTALMEDVTICHRGKKLRDEQIDEIISQLEQMVVLQPRNARHHYYMAFYNYLIHNEDKADQHVLEGINLLAKEDVETLLSMREASGLFGYYTRDIVKNNDALDHTIQSLLDLHEKIHPNTLFTSNLAVLLYRSGRLDDAANLFDESLSQAFNPTFTTLSFYENYIMPLYYFMDFIRETRTEKELLKIVLNVQTLSTKNHINIRKFFSFLNDYYPDFLNLIDGILKRRMPVHGVG